MFTACKVVDTLTIVPTHLDNIDKIFNSVKVMSTYSPCSQITANCDTSLQYV